MITILFATHNAHKVAEVNRLMPAGIRIVSLKEAGITDELAEPFDTLQANASAKSGYLEAMIEGPCFSEDSGLEVDALDGQPGVYSARFAGTHGDDAANIRKLLAMMDGRENRKARFRTVISFRWRRQEWQFEGVCEGHIAEAPAGTGGFGYDPVFIPEGHPRSFAEMTGQEKDAISHRGRAMQKFVSFLMQLFP